MIKILGLEYFKIRRKKIWTMIILFLVVEMLWAFMSISRSIAGNPDQAVWEAVFFSISSMNGLFMPIISAIVVSRICDMEHKGATWKMLVATNVSRGHLYAAKYICANSLLLYGILAQGALMIVFGLIKDFPGALPIELLSRFIGGSLLTTLAVTALQQWISMAIKNQAFALCLGMLGGFIGMTAGLFPDAVRHIFIWSYYLDLSPVTYLYAEPSGSYMAQLVSPGIVAAALIMTILFYIAGSIHVTRQEI
ncbi:multidrug ABC transporter permease [Paenibacillus antibioticophila]|uniref:Multidrug ABC transporter permease n=1 Tax=Paenibacillus antibioticophila TaxID=1274374 RepID=A0A919XSD9_9BACL|nr:ABC transporter permease [Paenibacillus antibioticophila]GIO38357.1 multidrug ABC transporter permease [Paenibacillus antibioticophila]